MPQTMTASTYATGAILVVALAAGALVSGVRKQLKEDNVRTGFLEQQQFDDILAHLPDDLHPPVTFSYLTGWRKT